MSNLCNMCGERPKYPNQAICNPCRWIRYGAKQSKRLTAPDGREKLRQWRRSRTISEATKARETRHSKQYRARYPEKEKAKRALNRAVENGIIVRPEACQECGRTDRGRDGRSLIQAHHDDYSAPLNVRWLCIQCHNNLHRALKDKP